MNIVLLYLLLLKGTVTAFAGLASLPVIQESLVNHHHVLTNEQLNEAVVITRSSPGGRSIAQNGLPVFRRRLVAGAERAHRRHVSADGSRFGELFHLLRGRHTPTDGPIGHGNMVLFLLCVCATCVHFSYVPTSGNPVNCFRFGFSIAVSDRS
jgi:hypothetical protein